MDLMENSTEASFRTFVRQWLAEHVPAMPAPTVVTRPWDVDFTRRFLKELDAAGLAGLTWPTEFGGRGLPYACQAIFLEESARAGASEHCGVIGLGMVGPTLVKFGSDEQKKRFLPRILSGTTVFCQGFSEPDAGSDLAAVATRAERDGDEFVVTGHKVWSSYAGQADHCLLLARGPDTGLTCLLLDMRVPGVHTRPLRQITGDPGFAEILLDRVRVPVSDAVGAPGDGWRVAMTTLAHERGTFGFTLTARLENLFTRLLDTVVAAGRTGDPVVRDRIAGLHIEIEALRLTNHRFLSTLTTSGSVGPETAVVKLRWSKASQRLAALAVELTADRDLPEWREYWHHEQLRARGYTIAGGTSEVLRNVIAERVVGLPRSR